MIPPRLYTLGPDLVDGPEMEVGHHAVMRAADRRCVDDCGCTTDTAARPSP
jgi:hypothetical protein